MAYSFWTLPDVETGRDTLNNQPTGQPTNQPTNQATDQPTKRPTNQATDQPSDRPTNRPTDQPNNHRINKKAIDQATDQRSNELTHQPTERTNHQQTDQPSRQPTNQPRRTCGLWFRRKWASWSPYSFPRLSDVPIRRIEPSLGWKDACGSMCYNCTALGQLDSLSAISCVAGLDNHCTWPWQLTTR